MLTTTPTVLPTAMISLLTAVAPTLAGGVLPPADHDEIWIGGWHSHNVIRIAWKDAEFRGAFVPSGGGGLSRAHDFSFGPDGHFYVASYGDSTVRRYHGETGSFIDVFVPRGDGLLNSHTTYWNGDGMLLVSSEGGDRVNRYDADGMFLGTFVAPGEAGLDGPEYIISGPDGFLYLAAQSDQVLKLDPNAGGVVERFVWDDPDIPGDETGGLSWAHGIAFGPDGNLYVASSNNNRILRYDGVTGDFIDAFVSGSGAPEFPIGIAFGPDGNLYVCAFATSRLLRYSGKTGAPLGTVANLPSLGLTGPLNLHFFRGPACFPDLDGSDDVGFADLLAVIAEWGPCAGCPEDLDGSGDVGFSDLLKVLARWGPCG
ncbi:MAG: hypothetical protein HKO59_04295 [Phycisphaerales bacterium]|nr:NHL repeat-containing protein [Phycisphaerae bacterium]NNF42372.1 hypothetical protein [Phycisphaerales bacterium]NNM25197.1 hypothetical protein [Phycisphaerales bacterium]